MDFFDGEWLNDELNGKGICQMPSKFLCKNSFINITKMGTVMKETFNKGNFMESEPCSTVTNAGTKGTLLMERNMVLGQRLLRV